MTIETESHRSLIRGLGLIAAISIIVGNVIGTGVFLKARVMTCNVGEPSWVLLAWVAAGLLSLAGALTYAELSAMKPEAGGEYVFLRDAFGRVWGFLYGWMMMFVGKTGAQASVAVVFAIGLNGFLDGKLGYTLFAFSLAGYAVEITTLQIIAVMMIMIFTTINCASVVLGGQIATLLTVIKIALVAFVGIGAFIFVTGGSFSHFAMSEVGGLCQGVAESARIGTASYSFTAGFAAAMLGALWGYDGWNNLSLMAGEIKDPGKNIPRALIGGTVLIILLYCFAHIAYFYVLTPTEIASVPASSSVAGTVVAKFFGGDLATFGTGIAVAIFAIGLMLSSIGTLHTSIMSGARIPYAMAQDGLMFKSLSKVSITGAPVAALILQGFWAALLALSGSFDTLTNYVVFGSWIFYGLATASVFVFRTKFPEAARPYKAWGYPVVPVIFLIVTGWLLVNTVITEPQSSLIGIFLIILGLPVYYYLNSINDKNIDRDNIEE